LAKKKEFTLTASGFEYDKELSRVPIKVFPALQALIANQHDLIEITGKYAPDKKIFLDGHRLELAEVEETVARAHAKYSQKKEEAKRKKEERDNGFDSAGEPPGASGLLIQHFIEPEPETGPFIDTAVPADHGFNPPDFSPGKPHHPGNGDPDIKRIAVNASVKALSDFLGRRLTEEEIAVIEKQVETYL